MRLLFLLTPGGVFINKCLWRHQCHFSELNRTPPSQILDPPLTMYAAQAQRRIVLYKYDTPMGCQHDCLPRVSQNRYF